MTAQELYKLSLAILFERENEDEDFKTFFLHFLNILLAESLPYENSIRVSDGREPLQKAPYLFTMTEEVPYDNTLLITAIPYGVASYYFQDDMDNYKSQDYRVRYVNALNDFSKANYTDIVDVYGKEVM